MNEVPVTENRIVAKESKTMYLDILEEIRSRRAAKRRGMDMEIRIKEMHCHMRQDELKEEEDELKIREKELKSREEAIKQRERELRLREIDLQKCRKKRNLFSRSTQ